MSLIADSETNSKTHKETMGFEGDFDEDNVELDEKDEGDCLSEPSTSNYQPVNSSLKLAESTLLANDDNFIDLNYSDEESGDEERHAKFEVELDDQTAVDSEIVMEKAIDISSSEDSDGEMSSNHSTLNGNSKNSPFNGANEQLISDEDEPKAKNEQTKEISSEDGEIDDLEEGELKSDSDDDIPVVKDIPAVKELQPIPTNNPNFKNIVLNNRNFINPTAKINASSRGPEDGVCKFFIRGNCNRAEACKYYHPPESEHSLWFHKLRVGSSIHQPILPPQASTQDHFQKPISLLSMPFGSNAAPKVPLNTVENAWERGLRQARELYAKKNINFLDKPTAEDKFVGNDSFGKSLEEERKQRFSETRSSESLIKRRLISLRSSDSQEELHQKSGNSLKNSERISEDISSPESLYKHHKTFNRSSHYNRSRSSSPDLESRNRRSSSRHELFKHRSTKVNSSRSTLNNSSTAEYSDPWARNRRSSPISDCSLNSTKNSTRKQRVQQSPHPEALSPVSSGRSTPTDVPRHFRSKRSPRRHRYSRRSSSERLKSDSSRNSSPLDHARRSRSRTSAGLKRRRVEPDMVSSSTHSSRDSSLSRKGKKQKMSRKKSNSLSPHERNARQNFGTTTLRSLLEDSETALRSGDLAEFRIPKKRRASLEEDEPPSSSRASLKFKKKTPVDVNKFFEKSEADAPAAYRIALNEEASDSERKPRRKRQKEEISLSSSRDSSRSSSSSSSDDTNTSQTSRKKSKKSLAEKPPSPKRPKESLKEKELILQPMQISSDENDDDDKSDSNNDCKNSHNEQVKGVSSNLKVSSNLIYSRKSLSKSPRPNEESQSSIKNHIKLDSDDRKKTKNERSPKQKTKRFYFGKGSKM